MRLYFNSLISLGLLFVPIVTASLNPIVIKGNAFFDSVTNERFYIRGVDYQVYYSPICFIVYVSNLLFYSLVDLLLLIMIR